MEVIKKYNNRKLYSTKLKKYVTLAYVLDLVKLGEKFTVIGTSENDITTETIKQSLNLVDIPQQKMVQFIRGL